MERSFKKEVQALRLGDGETFRGEGILAVTKALLQSGVSYVGGYQGAPVSHLLDVLVDAEDIMAELGVHLETCSNEASAAAMLGASINYPLRGAVTWKSIVGTNVAADALSNLSSPGVIGGAMIILGEDYGEGASVIQERSYAYALKSSMWLLDPRPDLPSIVRTVEMGFKLSEASHAPVMLELRIRACHATGEFAAKDNRKGIASGLDRLAGPPRFNYARLAHPPVIYAQEKLKIEQRLPAARKFVVEHKMNETIDGDLSDIGIVTMGGLTNSVLRALERMGLADVFGASRVPIKMLNVVYPLVPSEIREFCAGKRAVLVVEEGHPDYIEQAINVELRRADIQTKVYGKDVLPQAGEYTSEVLLEGLAAFLQAARPNGIDADTIAETARALFAHRAKAAAALGPIPPRPPAFCTGCPERPVFSALKLVQRELGPAHISADIGCHSFATFAPFSMGNSILGYGMSLASAAAVGPNMDRRSIAIMGDGGFWHNGLITGVASNLFNKGDGVLIVMQNGYTSATGQQYMPSSLTNRDGTPPGMDIEKTLRSMGVRWLRTVRTYGVATMVKTLKEAMKTAEKGLKVIIADGECQLARQRRVRAEDAIKLKDGKRVTRTRYGVDGEICTGDHSCIRLSGCPSLTVKPSPDPLRTDPVASVVDSCVGCGLCGEVAHAAVLCPSFYRAEIIRNATAWDRVLFKVRQTVVGWLGGYDALSSPPPLRGRSPSKARREGGEQSAPFMEATPLPNPPPQGGREIPGASAGKTDNRSITLLIAALGGEGGGVLTNWIVGAAQNAGFPVQSTSIPGVAQRTGATTYYIEIFPVKATELNGKRPVMALTPGVGDIDVAVASELLEAGRTIAAGFVTSARTHVIASLSRFYAMDEKIAMGDGRVDSERLIKVINDNAQDALLFDMAKVAAENSSIVSAVMLGAIAGSRRLPLTVAQLENAIRVDGKSVETNLRGFRAGLEAARARSVSETQDAPALTVKKNAPLTLTSFEDEVSRALPAPAQHFAIEGVRRLASYQSLSYARLYLDRLASMAAADAASGAQGKLVKEIARHLAVRMSYEDVVRVAQAKIAPERMRRIARDELHVQDEPYSVHDFLKPGIEELCQLLPSFLARPVLAVSERRGWLGRVYFGMEINSTSVSGYLRFALLAKLRGVRPYGHRYAQEQRQIESWLALITEAAQRSAALALEVAEGARLIKGYGDTYARGLSNYRSIEARVIRPALAGHIPLDRAADAVASARTAALVDPDGESLARCLAEVESQVSFRIAAE